MQRLIVTAALGSLWIIPNAPLLGQTDPVDEQLRSLREDLRVAVDVETLLEKVDALRHQASAPPEVRKAVDYLAGELLVDAARAERRSKKRLALVERAEKRFRQCLEDQPRDALGARAATKVASTMFERAQRYMGGVEHEA